MLKNYMLAIWRYASRNKVFTGINLLGLVIGISSSLLIFQFVSYELSFDRFWPKYKNVYRVQLKRYDKGELSTHWASGCAGVGPDMKSEFEEVDLYARLKKSNAVLSHGDTFFKEDGVFYCSADFFRVFGYPLLMGDDSLALRGPNKIVLSQTLARKYFGNENPLGKTIYNNANVAYEVTGVFADLPENTHLKIDALLSFGTFAKLTGRANEEALNEWQWDGFTTYVSLKENK